MVVVKLKDFDIQLNGFYNTVYLNNVREFDKMTDFIVKQFENGLVVFKDAKHKTFCLKDRHLKHFFIDLFSLSLFVIIPEYDSRLISSDDAMELLARFLAPAVFKKYTIADDVFGEFILDRIESLIDSIRNRKKPSKNNIWKAENAFEESVLDSFLNYCIDCKYDNYTEEDVVNEIKTQIIDTFDAIME